MYFGPQRKTQRADWADYSASGLYFVTICVKDRKNVFGEVYRGRMCLNGLGAVAWRCWLELPKHFSYAGLDEFVVMPNHVHGIVQITNDDTSHHPRRGGQLSAPTGVGLQPQPRSLSIVIRTFKAAVTTWAWRNGHVDFRWQRSFHDHIIRSNADLERIQNYIALNPPYWSHDKYFSNPKT